MITCFDPQLGILWASILHNITYNVMLNLYRSFAQQCHNSKFVIFKEKLLKILKCYNFLWVQRRHNCSPAASFANCVMTLYLLKSASANVSFYTNNSKMPNFELWHSCRKWGTFLFLSLYYKNWISYRPLPTKLSQLKISDFSGERFKFLKFHNFLWVQRQHNCSLAASFANCVMTLYLLKSAPANVSFYTNNSKMPNFELWQYRLCRCCANNIIRYEHEPADTDVLLDFPHQAATVYLNLSCYVAHILLRHIVIIT
jgi:hypothetical protein